MLASMTLIVSHRGGATLWPENSRIAFENTARLPVDQVEFDVHFSADERLVVIHDATLERTTDGTGPVVARTWAELSRLTLRGTGGDRMLLLDEVIELFRPTPLGLRVEIKPGPNRAPYRGLSQCVVNVLRDQGVLDRSTVTSFQLGTVCEAAAAVRPAMHAWLVTPDLQTDLGIEGIVATARTNGVPMLALRSDRIDEAIIAQVQAQNLVLGAWACNDEAIIRRVFQLGVAGFTTDRPDIALRLRPQNRRL